MSRVLLTVILLAAVAWPQRVRRPAAAAPEGAPGYAADLFPLGQVITNRPDVAGVPGNGLASMVWKCQYSPSPSGTPGHTRYFWYEAEPAWAAALAADHPVRRMVEGVVAQCPLHSNWTAAQVAAAQAPARAAAAPVVAKRPAAAVQPLGFTAKGLENEPALLHLYRGEFARVELRRESVQFAALFRGYMLAYGQRCAGSLPADKVEITRTECTRERHLENGLGQNVGGSMCVETREVGTGIYADPVLHAADEALERATRTKGVPGMSVGPGMIGDVLSMSLDVRRMGNDMRALVEMNGCATPALKRFEANLIAYSAGTAGIVAPPAQPAAETGAAQGPFVDANYAALLEALIGEQAEAWALNKFIPGSVTQVWVQGRDASGRPAMISANYSVQSLLGAGRGSVRLDFVNGEPECLYYADFPTTCKKASRRIVNAYLEGAYR